MAPSSQVSRRQALELIGKTSLVALLAAACRTNELPIASAEPERPNIIYMHSHDTGRYIEPYGHDISTPHLQRFADEGMLFRQAFSASPTCSPSRAALLTGMTPGCNGMWGLPLRGYELNDYSQHLIHTLKKAGYTSALAGVQHIAAGKPRDCARRIGYDTLLKVKNERARHVADAAVAFLEKPHNKPFFLDVGFAETHLLPGGESRFGYENGNMGRAEIPAGLADTPDTRRDMADYETAAEVLDEGMGSVLNALERQGLKNNTLVIITTDHGIPLPGMKSNHTDGGLGVMMMVRGPFGFSGGKVSNALVSQLDIFPTLCEVLGLEAPVWLQGTSLLPLVSGKSEQINEAVFAEHEAHAVREPQASVRTERYKYIRRLNGDDRVRARNTDRTYTKELWLREGWAERSVDTEQLYDLLFDPGERNNLADDPDYQDTLQNLRSLMVTRMNRYDNPLLRRYQVANAPPERLELAALVAPSSAPRDQSYEFGVVFTDASDTDTGD